jgi:hypothetical protein
VHAVSAGCRQQRLAANKTLALCSGRDEKRGGEACMDFEQEIGGIRVRARFAAVAR